MRDDFKKTIEYQGNTYDLITENEEGVRDGADLFMDFYQNVLGKTVNKYFVTNQIEVGQFKDFCKNLGISEKQTERVFEYAEYMLYLKYSDEVIKPFIEIEEPPKDKNKLLEDFKNAVAIFEFDEDISNKLLQEANNYLNSDIDYEKLLLYLGISLEEQARENKKSFFTDWKYLASDIVSGLEDSIPNLHFTDIVERAIDTKGNEIEADFGLDEWFWEIEYIVDGEKYKSKFEILMSGNFTDDLTDLFGKKYNFRIMSFDSGNDSFDYLVLPYYVDKEKLVSLKVFIKIFLS